MKRTLFLLLLTLLAALALTGCSSSADTEPSVSPGMTTASPLLPSNIPQATDGGLLGDLGEKLDDTLNGRDDALTTSEDALKASQELRDAVQKLTEVDTAVAVAVGNTALVGVTLDDSYRGGVDERLQGMVLDRAQSIHGGITEIAVTADEKAVEEITSLYDMLRSGSPYTTVKANADTLAEGMDLYKK